MNADLGRGESPGQHAPRPDYRGRHSGVHHHHRIRLRASLPRPHRPDLHCAHPFPAPTLIAAERAQRLALEAPQKRDLQGARGRTPIDLAMKAIAAKGPHAFDPLESQQ